MKNTGRNPLIPGSLDLLILRTLKTGPKHGYLITSHLGEVSDDFLQIEEGSLYPALHRMERRGWITSQWGTSDANRRAKYYKLSPDGRKQLKIETESWKKMSAAIDQVLNFQTS